ncbi:MAG: hypothetical protein JW761_11815 [Prolixibacteraceae bacterium]|nr:hypothetical protein [Prolixibacteraceae bacterium]
MVRKIIIAAICITTLPIAVFSVQQFTAVKIGGTGLWWAIEFFTIAVFVVAAFVFGTKEVKKGQIVLMLFLLYMVFSIFRGFFKAENYWDYKGLVNNAFGLLLPIAIFAIADKNVLQSVLSFFVRYGLLLALPILIPTPIGAWGWYLFPINFLILFLPALKNQWKVLLIAITIIVTTGDISTRSHLIKYLIPVLLLSLYYFRFFIATDEITQIGTKVLMFAPWILFVLGVTGVFNVFRMNEYIKANYTAETTNAQGEVKKQDITNDSRTFMYEEALQSAKKYDYWLLGRSPARGNETFVFADAMLEITGRRERLRNEAGIPNFFTWTGIIGVMFYFFVFYRATYLAVNKSNNIYSKIIGLYTAFHWAYTWVENNGAFGMNTFTICLYLAICFSASFRKMNNLEVKMWARGIFSKKYVKYMRYSEKNIATTFTPLKKLSLDEKIYT